jgi:uncharacterized protein YfkK (UPF0435 family)
MKYTILKIFHLSWMENEKQLPIEDCKLQRLPDIYQIINEKDNTSFKMM